MGNELGADTQHRDGITGMTSQEKHVVRDVAIFVVLFLKHPAYQKLCAAFAADPIAELPQNPRAIAHALTVAYAISSIIDTLDEPETSAELVRKVATNHVRHPSISGAQFEHMGQATMDVLTEKLGSAMNHQAIGSWQKFFAFVVRVSQSVFKASRILASNTGGPEPQETVKVVTQDGPSTQTRLIRLPKIPGLRSRVLCKKWPFRRARSEDT